MSKIRRCIRKTSLAVVPRKSHNSTRCLNSTSKIKRFTNLTEEQIQRRKRKRQENMRQISRVYVALAINVLQNPKLISTCQLHSMIR